MTRGALDDSGATIALSADQILSWRSVMLSISRTRARRAEISALATLAAAGDAAALAFISRELSPSGRPSTARHVAAEKRRRRESDLVCGLCRLGYTFIDQRGSARTNEVIDLATRKFTLMREFRLVVPMESALSLAMPLVRSTRKRSSSKVDAPRRRRGHPSATHCDRELARVYPRNDQARDGEVWVCSCGRRFVHTCDEAEGCGWSPMR